MCKYDVISINRYLIERFRVEKARQLVSIGVFSVQGFSTGRIIPLEL
jgi:hypothetical protein